jgi:cobalt-zinc-cadmium efflux system outer membrane protein
MLFVRRGHRRRLALLVAPLLPGCLLFSKECYPDGTRQLPPLGPADVAATGLLGPAAAPPPAEPVGPPAPPPEPGRVQDRLRLPPELPGASASPLSMPLPRPTTRAEREAAVRSLLPPEEPLGSEIQPALPPTGRPWTLADLQELAKANSPVLRRAAADVTAARGAVIQAGLHPNPTVGYEADQVQPGPTPGKNNAGQQGGFINQLIKTGGKLQLAQAVALMDQFNAELALRRAEVDLAAAVRTHYFGALVAQESLTVNRALVRLSDEVYRVQIAQVGAGQAAPYEPVQLYVQAVQARNALIAARNRYVSAWKQLAAALGRPELPPTALAGRADAPVPHYAYDEAAARVAAAHTDVLSAENTIVRARYALRLAEVNRLPDLQTNTVVQHDNAAGNDQFNLQVGFALPIFDRNQGNILQAKGQLERAIHDLAATRNDLIRQLAAAFERYETNRRQLTNDRDKILPNLVRVYRAIYLRYQQEPDKIAFSDIVVAQQNLATALATYLSDLNDQWAAVVDVANLLQTDDLYETGPGGACPPPPVANLIEGISGPPVLPPPTAEAARPTEGGGQAPPAK